MNDEKMDFDDFGTYTVPHSPDDPEYDIRAMIAYCKDNNKSTENLTDDEVKMFRIN